MDNTQSSQNNYSRNIDKYLLSLRKGMKWNLKTLIKGTIIVILLTCIFLNCLYGFGLPSNDIGCIEDESHKLTEGVNKYLQENPHVANSITIFSSLCIDFIMLSICFHWVFRGQSWRFLVCLFLFYSLRALVQGLFQMRYPDGYTWNYPGLPSLAVSYLRTNDFFFSGHVGLPVIVACEFVKHNQHYLAYFALFGCLVEFAVMTIMRGHYIIDLIFGIITAHYIFIMVDKYIHIIDNSIVSLVNESNLSAYMKLKKTYKETEEVDSLASTISSDEDVNGENRSFNRDKFY